MRTYAVYGTTFSSTITFQELTVTDAAPEWTLRRSHDCDANAEAISREELEPGFAITISSLPTGFRVERTWLGPVDVNVAARTMTWIPDAHECEGCLRSLVIGRVLPLALHFTGAFTLHGSAVAIGDEGIAFLAPKGSGKSTLAYALLEGGAFLASDDCVPVQLEGSALMHPGVSQLRLCDDSAENFVSGTLPVEEVFAGKHLLARPAEDRTLTAPVPLRTIYILEPLEAPTASHAIRRRQLPSGMAVMSLMEHTKVGALLDAAEQRRVFRKAAALASMVPVYALEVHRDYSRLPAVVSALLGWHRAPEDAEVTV